MKKTELIYMSHMDLLTCEATVLDVQEKEGKTIIILDQTVFYPQGGGQPYDTGLISSETGELNVEEVRFVDGYVHHIGTISGNITKEQKIQCSVDAKRRELHSRIHSAGHVLDMAIQSLGLAWIPGKGFHFPEGPYVEYSGIYEGDIQELKNVIEEKVNSFVTSTPTTIQFMDTEEMKKIGLSVPEYLPKDKPSRVVFYGVFGVPCGGTHVNNLQDIGNISIRKIKQKKGKIKISYQVN